MERLLGRSLPTNERIGESWECADLESGQSVGTRGLARGKALRQLVEEWGPALLGRAALHNGRFPLLIKYLDACEDLSVQVHPDPEAARRICGRACEKHEAWYILEAAPGAVIYRGLAPGVTVEALAAGLNDRPERVVSFLRRIPVRAGEVFYLPAGTVHALGAGVVVAEVQTPSDITYRLYDWGRVRPQGDAGLHIAQALACIRPEVDYAAHETRTHVASVFTTVTRLVTCPCFVIEKVRFVGGVEVEIPYAELVCWIVLEGRGEIRYDSSDVHRPASETFTKGEVVVLPAGLKGPRLKTMTDCVWLEVTVPAPSDLAAFPRPDPSDLRASPGGEPGVVRLRVPDAPDEESP